MKPVTVSSVKTGSFTAAVTTDTSWTDVPIYDESGNALSATNIKTVRTLIIINEGAAGFARINEGVPFRLPTGSVPFKIAIELYKLEILREGSTDMSGVYAFGTNNGRSSGF